MGKTYVEKYFYTCNKCGFETYSYRNCNNDSCPKCDGRLIETNRIEKPIVEDDIEITTSVSTDSITPYFDVALGREISSKSEIRKICKEKGWVYGDSKDLDADAERNKRYNEEKFRNGMMNEILRNI